MPEAHARAYADLRNRTIEFVRTADPTRLDAPAPATPEWRGRDVLAHMVGVNDDVVNGRLEGIATDAWTQAQVDARVDDSVAEMLDEWQQHADAFGALLTDAPEEIVGQAIYDAVTHEHDLRNAVDRPGNRESDAVTLAWNWVVGARTRSGLPAIRFVTEAGEVVGGAGDPKATVKASQFELVRATSGRRSASEVAGYGWDCEPNAELLLAAPFFTVRPEPLNE
jgi:uncharacterized protein (TIGR03083 family)